MQLKSNKQEKKTVKIRISPEVGYRKIAGTCGKVSGFETVLQEIYRILVVFKCWRFCLPLYTLFAVFVLQLRISLFCCGSESLKDLDDLELSSLTSSMTLTNKSKANL